MIPNDITVVIETWPYNAEQVERAALSVTSLASRIILLGAEGAQGPLSSFQQGMVEWAAVPWHGDFSAWRNRLLSSLDTDWVLWLYGNEQFVRIDARTLAEAAGGYKRTGFRLSVADATSRSRLGTDPVRLFPRGGAVRFSGRLVPAIGGALAEFGYAVEDLPVRIDCPDGRGPRGQRKQWENFVVKHLEGQLSQSPESRIKLATVYAGAQEWDLATQRIEESQSTITQLGDSWRLQLLWVRAYIATKRGQLETAESQLAAAVKEYPYSTDLLFLYGTVLFELQKHDASYATMLEALTQGEDLVLYSEAGAGSYLCRRWLAKIQTARRRYKEAVKEYMNLLEQYPFYRSVWIELLDILDGSSPREIVDLLSLVMSKNQMRAYLAKQSYLSPIEAQLRDWLDQD